MCPVAIRPAICDLDGIRNSFELMLGLCIKLAPFDQSFFTDSAMCRLKRKLMNKPNEVKNILVKLREAYHNQLDTRDLEELDQLIEQFKRLEISDERLLPEDIITKALLVIDVIVRAVTNVVSLIDTFR